MAKIEIDDEDLKKIVKEVINEKFGKCSSLLKDGKTLICDNIVFKADLHLGRIPDYDKNISASVYAYDDGSGFGICLRFFDKGEEHCFVAHVDDVDVTDAYWAGMARFNFVICKRIFDQTSGQVIIKSTAANLSRISRIFKEYNMFKGRKAKKKSEDCFINPPYDELMKDNKCLKTQIEAYDIQYIDTKKACDKWMQMYSDEAMRCNDIDIEFEEMARGDLMNLKLVKKYLDKVRPTAKTKDEYLKAINFIDTDISNLDKFVEERWGTTNEEER